MIVPALGTVFQFDLSVLHSNKGPALWTVELYQVCELSISSLLHGRFVSQVLAPYSTFQSIAKGSGRVYLLHCSSNFVPVAVFAC